MRTLIRCGVCGGNLVSPRKGEANGKLRQHIRERAQVDAAHNKADRDICKAGEEIRALEGAKRVIKADVLTKTGYKIPGY